MAKRSAKTPATVQERITALKRELALLHDDLQARELCETWPTSFFCAPSETWPDGKNEEFGKYDFDKAFQNTARLSAQNFIRAVILHLNEHRLTNPMRVALVELPKTNWTAAQKEEYVRVQLKHLLGGA